VEKRPALVTVSVWGRGAAVARLAGVERGTAYP